MTQLFAVVCTVSGDARNPQQRVVALQRLTASCWGLVQNVELNPKSDNPFKEAGQDDEDLR
jgi:hypothetical protein